MPNWVLGLDGGGTKTLLAWANVEGEVLGLHRGDGICPFGQPSWQRILKHLLDEAPCPADITSATFALPGYGEVAEVSRLQEEAVDHWAHGLSVTVMNDVEAAFIGAFLGGPGVLVLAGTGSMAWGRDRQGRSFRVGGWGEGFGDEGSAHWIGLSALRKLSWCLDGRLEDSFFAEKMLKAVGAKDAEGLRRWFYHNTVCTDDRVSTSNHRSTRAEVASLAEEVDYLAEGGNRTALGILDTACKLLYQQAEAVRNRMSWTGIAPLSYAGSVFNSRVLREEFQRLARNAGVWALQEPFLPPVGGALWYAATQAGWHPDEAWALRIRSEIKERCSRSDL